MKRNVLITGAGGNLGRVCVNYFIELGYHVTATVSPGKKNSFSPTSLLDVTSIDLAMEPDCINLVRTMVDRHSTIDAALILAGGFAVGNLERTGINEIRRMIQLNFETAFNIVRPVFLEMKKQNQGGRIILVGAMSALNPSVGKEMLAYSLSKVLLVNLAEMLNAESVGSNIHTYVIAPGIIDTPDNRNAMPDADFSSWITPEEIAATLKDLSNSERPILKEEVVKLSR